MREGEVFGKGIICSTVYYNKKREEGGLDDPDPRIADVPHDDCFTVDTHWRRSSAAEYDGVYHETSVWRDSELLMQEHIWGEPLKVHFDLCRLLSEHGRILAEDERDDDNV